MANKSGIELVIDPQATTFSTDGRRLKIPPIAKLTEWFPCIDDLETYIIGAVVHEAGHIRFTDRTLRVGFKKSFTGHAKYKMADVVGQCMEDVAIERTQCNALPGARPALTKLWKLLYDGHSSEEAHAQADAVFTHYVFFRARHSVLKTEWTLAACETAAIRLASTFTHDQITLLENELAVLDLVSSTADAVALSLRLLRLVGVEPVSVQDDEDQPESDANKGPDQQPQGGASKPADSPEHAERGQGDHANQESTPCAGAETATDGPDKPESEDDEAEGATGPSGQTEPGNESGRGEPLDAVAGEETQVSAGAGGLAEVDPLELISMAVQELQEELPEATEYEFVMPGLIPGSSLASVEFEEKHRGGMELRSKILVHTMMASARLSTLLKAQTESKTEFCKRGKIVPSRLWKLQAGSTRVFRHTVEGKDLNTAIKVLLDRSLSMKKTMKRAIEAACFLPMAFDDVSGISTSIDIFPGTLRAAESLKRFGERTMPCLDALASVRAKGGTPLGAALEISGMELVQFNAERRLLVVITDGAPDRLNEAKAQLRALESADVEVIGIGIGVSLKHLFTDFVSVNQVGELTNVLYHLMERKLIRLPLAA
ncbi:hypothetical protein [Rhodoferax ferrireducens]|nr:hypothetical protein [Rhodoferax ferrireducens]